MADVDVAAIETRYQRACDELDRMTSAPGGPGASWRWSIPANPERDSDLLLADSLADILSLLTALERAQAASDGVDMLIAQAERRGAVRALQSLAAAYDEKTRDKSSSFETQSVSRSLAGAFLLRAQRIENGAKI